MAECLIQLFSNILIGYISLKRKIFVLNKRFCFLFELVLNESPNNLYGF